jgi:hypothetical protein
VGNVKDGGRRRREGGKGGKGEGNLASLEIVPVLQKFHRALGTVICRELKHSLSRRLFASAHFHRALGIRINSYIYIYIFVRYRFI